MRLSNVVLPAPRKPVSTVTGMRAFLFMRDISFRCIAVWVSVPAVAASVATASAATMAPSAVASRRGIRLPASHAAALHSFAAGRIHFPHRDRAILPQPEAGAQVLEVLRQLAAVPCPLAQAHGRIGA